MVQKTLSTVSSDSQSPLKPCYQHRARPENTPHRLSKGAENSQGFPGDHIVPGNQLQALLFDHKEMDPSTVTDTVSRHLLPANISDCKHSVPWGLLCQLSLPCQEKQGGGVRLKLYIWPVMPPPRNLESAQGSPLFFMMVPKPPEWPLLLGSSAPACLLPSACPGQTSEAWILLPPSNRRIATCLTPFQVRDISGPKRDSSLSVSPSPSLSLSFIFRDGFSV